MKKVYLIAMVLLPVMMLSACEGQTTTPQNPKVQALDDFDQEILERYLLRLEEYDQNQILEETLPLARHNIIDNKAALFEKAKYSLSRYPVEQIDMSQWTPLEEKWQTLVDNATGNMRRGFEGGAAKGSNFGLALYRAWDPIRIAQNCRMIAFGHMGNNQGYGKRMFLEAIASPRVFEVDNNPYEPVIAIETPIDLVVVTLHYNYDGIYIPVDIKCYDSVKLPEMKNAVEAARKVEELKRRQEETRMKKVEAARAAKEQAKQAAELKAKNLQENAAPAEAKVADTAEEPADAAAEAAPTE
ncbi:MAG: hypothetical protein JXA52_00455 [Planctomycetes bacterium]|nr:hypothetical protein [Planctomycetota bacterium]